MNILKSALALSLSLFTSTQSLVSSVKANSIPTQTYDLVGADNQSAGELITPDFSQITLGNLGSFSEPGFIPSDYDHYAGYGLGRQWQAGDAVIDVLKLGDLEEALGVGQFRLGEIVTKSGREYRDVTLDSFGLLEHQTVASLLKAVPQLQNQPIKNVPLLADLVVLVYGYRGRPLLEFPTRVLTKGEKELFGYFHLDRSIRSQKLASVYLSQIETPEPSIDISDVELGELDLSEYTLEDVAEIGDSFVEDFEGWKDEYLSEIEALTDISLDDFPNPVATTLAFISRVDAIWSDAHGEIKRGQSVSGSNISGYAVPCNRECAHIELDDLENAGRDIRSLSEGRRWMLGNDPTNANICPEAPWGVDGGEGLLGNFNCGKEPTGRNPFGPVFKVALWSVDETTDTATTSIFFRFCVRQPVDLGCTPYFIGPIPFLPANRDSWIILGPGF